MQTLFIIFGLGQNLTLLIFLRMDISFLSENRAIF